MRLSLEAQYHQGDSEVMSEVPLIELLRSPISHDEVASTRLVANLFDGGPRSSMSFAIDGGSPNPMTRVADPHRPVHCSSLQATRRDHQEMGQAAAIVSHLGSAAAVGLGARNLRLVGSGGGRVRARASRRYGAGGRVNDCRPRLAWPRRTTSRCLKAAVYLPRVGLANERRRAWQRSLKALDKPLLQPDVTQLLCCAGLAPAKDWEFVHECNFITGVRVRRREL